MSHPETSGETQAPHFAKTVVSVCAIKHAAHIIIREDLRQRKALKWRMLMLSGQCHSRHVNLYMKFTACGVCRPGVAYHLVVLLCLVCVCVRLLSDPAADLTMRDIRCDAKHG